MPGGRAGVGRTRLRGQGAAGGAGVGLPRSQGGGEGGHGTEMAEVASW